ncbi:MAG TPA: DUF1345 domain-containing protein [Polyangiaceae bacterium]|nr:DUF1345 domain-containing protein [Polyangiaceae bacterium]
MLVTSLLGASSGQPWHLRAMVGWDAAALTWLGLVWQILLRSDARTTELRAGDEDPGVFLVFVIVVLSSLFSLFASTVVLRMMRGQMCGSFWVALALVSVGLSWIVTHTAYTLRYAHLFYTGDVNGGLEFPGTKTPCDMDFAYYGFTLGMCFQVSDVQITASDIRRVTLGHALVSFIFNTMIVGLSLNVIFQFLGG